MRMNKGAILLSMAIIALASVLVGAGTMAYFNQTVQATGNTFTAGNLDVRLSATGAPGSWSSGPINGYWNSPTGWAPGETFTRKLWFKNFGNVDVQVILVDFKNYVSIAGSTNFWDKIEIITFTECKLPGTNYAPPMATWIGNNIAPLTLKELIQNPNNVGGTVGFCDVILYEDPALPPHGAPLCTATHKNLLGNTYLGPGEVGWLEIGFKFSSTAGIAYQNAQCSFDLQMSFIQGPDSGVCRHELPGWVP